MNLTQGGILESRSARDVRGATDKEGLVPAVEPDDSRVSVVGMVLLQAIARRIVVPVSSISSPNAKEMFGVVGT